MPSKFDIQHHDCQKIKYLIIVCNRESHKSKTTSGSLSGLSWNLAVLWLFFWSSSLKRVVLSFQFFFQIPRTCNSLILNFFQIPETGSSKYLNLTHFWFFFKYLELLVGATKNQIPTNTASYPQKVIRAVLIVHNHTSRKNQKNQFWYVLNHGS
jgi:hypothetical protein